jgi:hypothetical protein
MKLGSVKVRILDEVNVVFVGLKGEHVDRLYEKYGVFAPNYFFAPTFKLGQWDGKIRYFHKTGKTYLFLLDEILPIVVGYGYKIVIEDLRKTQIVQPDPITADIFADIPHMDTGEPIILREYQVNLANALIQEGYGIGLSSTGSGKTLTMAAVVKAYNQKGIRTITIVPNQSLVRQTKLEYINCKLDTGEYSGTEKTLNHQNVVSTWQALQNNLKVVGAFDMVIVDECLDGSTLISLPNGSTMPIKDIQTGDKVLSYNASTRKFEEDEVIKKHTNLAVSSTEKMYRLEFDTGVTLELTGNHKILTERGYVRADEITNEDNVIFDGMA